MRHKKSGVKIVDWKLALVSYSLALMVVASIALPVTMGVLTLKYVDIPKFDSGKITKLPQRTKILAADNSVLATFYFQDREMVDLKSVPKSLQKAVLAIEDHRFYKHSGVDIRSIGRAFITNVKSGGVKEGGSTITQQFVKNAYLSNERSLSRKIREAVLAHEMEQKYSKREILSLYLNTIYFGNGAYGVKTAAEIYYHKPLSSLTLGESALLAGLTKSPTKFSPFLHPKAARRRRRVVLKHMLKYHFINRAQYAAAEAEPIKPAPKQEYGYQKAPYFVEYIRQAMIEKVGARKFLRGGLKIYTTLDPKKQAYAEQAVRNILNRPGDPSASLVSLEPRTGYIRAMVGGRDFRNDEFNLAVQGRRQAGSSFKTFVLVAALEEGISPNETFSGASPIVIRLPKPGPDWSVKNYGGESYGTMPISEATVKSVNVVYAQLIMRVGVPKVIEVAKKMGIRSPINPNPAIALGGLTHGVSPLDMASAYATLANGGKHCQPRAIIKIVDNNNKVIYRAKIKSKRVLSAKVAFQANQILQQVVERGTGTRADIGRPQAGKTGTSQNLRDAWFVGYTPDLATAVWVGYPHNSVEMTSVHGISVVGGSFPAEIWRNFMAKALQGVKPTAFLGPDGKHAVVAAKPPAPKKSYRRPRPATKPAPSVAPSPPPPPVVSPPPAVAEPPATPPKKPETKPSVPTEPTTPPDGKDNSSGDSSQTP